jgi:hypothetical protein
VNEQLTLTFAKARADVEIERSADHADRCVDGLVDTACEKLREFALSHTVPFTIEQFRVELGAALAEPADKRAFGAVTRRARKLGYIAQVPGQYAPAVSSNGAAKALYVKGLEA